MNIAFIGCGKLGLPCAEEIVKAGHTVTGYDPAYIYRKAKGKIKVYEKDM